MKFFNIVFLLVILALACSFTLANDESPFPPGKRLPLKRPIGKAAKLGGTTTTTTTTADPRDAEEGDYAEEPLEGEGEGEDEVNYRISSTTTTTTEAPKKIGPVIRPFRSNEDLLNSLKRRQMNAKKHRGEKPAAKPTKAAAEERGNEAEESAPAPSPVLAKKKANSSPYNRRKFTKPGKSDAPAEDAAAEGSEQEQKEELKPKRPSGRLPPRRS